MDPTGRDLILYDGECGLCAASVQFVLARDRQARFVYAPLQGALARTVLGRHGREVELNSFILVTDRGTEHERLHERARGAAAVLLRLGGAWPLLGVLLAAIPGFIANRGYDLVAKNRHRLFAPSQCFVPSAAERARFLEG